MPISHLGLYEGSESTGDFLSFSYVPISAMWLYFFNRREALLRQGGPVWGAGRLPHPFRLHSRHTPFIFTSDCCVSSCGPGIYGLESGTPTPSSGLPLWLSSWCQRKEQRLGSSRKGSGRVNTGQMLPSLFRDPVY